MSEEPRDNATDPEGADAPEPTPDPTPPPDAASTPEAEPAGEAQGAPSPEAGAPDHDTPDDAGAQQAAADAGAVAMDLPELNSAVGGVGTDGIDLLSDVNVNVRIELGRTEMLVEDVLRLGEGAVVELDKLAGDPVDIFVNDRPVARGEVLVLNDNFCVRVNEILSPAPKSAPNGEKRVEEPRTV